MPDDQAPQQPQESDEEKFRRELRQDLGQFAQGVRNELGAIRQQVAQPQHAPAPAPQIAVPADINDRLRERMIGDPLEFVKEVTGVATQQAEARARAILSERDQRDAAAAQHQQFWQTFYSFPQNQDVGAFHDQLYSNFMRGGHINDPSARADWAADQIRQALAARSQAEQQAAARQKQGVRAAAGAPGSQRIPMQAQQEYAPEPEQRNPQAELMQAVDELAQQRAKKSWHNIDTAAYRDLSRDREVKVRQDKYIAAGRR